MTERKWKSGASGCWWAIVPIADDPMYPLPWAMGSTRAQAWNAWRDWLGDAANASTHKVIRVFITEAK